MGEVFGENYPERSWKTIILPVPGFVRVLVNGMLWFLDPVTRAKISICSTNEQGAQGAELDTKVVEAIMAESLEFEGQLLGAVDEEDEEGEKKDGETAETAKKQEKVEEEVSY